MDPRGERASHPPRREIRLPPRGIRARGRVLRRNVSRRDFHGAPQGRMGGTTGAL